LPIGLLSAVAAHRRRKRRESAIAHTAHVLAFRERGENEPGFLTVEIELLVLPDDSPAYRSTLETRILGVMKDNFAAGKVLVARVTRGRPHDIALDVI
jgi:hypothetical protein